MATAASSSSASDWCTVESDPGVFTELLETLGVQGVELQELWSLDDESLRQLQEESEIYGLIFLFQWNNDNKNNNSKKTKQEQQQQQPSSSSSADRMIVDDEDIPTLPPHLFFAHQVTTNACATQAILSVLLNRLPNPQLGPLLQEFKSFTHDFPPSLRGMAISSSPEIKTAHNSFARPDAFLNEEKVRSSWKQDEGEAFHFVAYIPFDLKQQAQDQEQDKVVVYELDGLQAEPIVVGTTTTTSSSSSSSSWLTVAREAIQTRMDQEQHVKYNLMAVIQDKRIRLQEQLSSSLLLDDNGTTTTTTTTNSSETNNELVLILSNKLEAENAKRHEWKLENQRRRHNYVPLCIELLKGLARCQNQNHPGEGGAVLQSLLEQAQQKKQERIMADKNNSKNSKKK